MRPTIRGPINATLPALTSFRLVIAFVIALCCVAPAGAHDATPTPEVPAPELCTVAAPAFERLNAVVRATPVSGTPAATRTPGVTPAGTPASEETAAAITQTIRELVGCYNSGELLRAFGLYTDGYLNRLFNRQGGFTREVYDSYATPEPVAPPTERTAILEIKEVRVFGNGSAGATVTLRYAGIPVPKTFFVSFEWNGERWMISDILGEITFSVP